MYSIFCDGVCIHHGPSPDENLKVLEPKLKLSDNAAGTLTFKIPPNNVRYDNIHRLTSEIVVKRKNFNDTYNKVVYEEIWSGRVIEEKEDFWKNREITCEGELGYLNDTTQPPNEYHNITPTTFLQALINIHNSKCEESKRFTVGIVTVTDPNDSLYRYTNFESTYEAIKDKLLDRLGGHLRVRKVNNIRYLDYLQDYPSTNTQTIEFGKNLIEFSKNFDASELVTAIVPLGCNVTELDMEPTYSALEEYLTVESVNGGSIYVSSPEAVSNYGWIETVVHWNDVKTPSILLSKARAYLSDAQFEDMSLELSAVDLHSMDIHTEAIWLLDRIRCISKPHGMDRIFPILKIDIPLDKPEDTKYTLGEKVKSTGISASVRDTNAQIIKKIDELPTTSSVLRQAKEESLELLNMKTNGFITITTEEDPDGKYHSDALYISDIKDVTASNRYWKWNMNGLAYYKNKNEVGLALRMDGAIVADRILAGKLGKPEWGNYWDMETGEFILSPGRVKTGDTNYYKHVVVRFDSQSSSESTSYDWVDVVWKNESGTYSYVRRGGYSSTWADVYIPAVYGELYIYWRSDGSAHNYNGFRVNSISSYSSGSSTTPTGTRSTIVPSGDTVINSYTVASSSAYSNIKTTNFPSYYTDGERKLWTVTINNITPTEATLANYTEGKVDELDNSLNQESVFNRLTNNGTVQGITMSGGQLYINATYINAGTMSANLIKGGVIKSQNDTMKIDLNNNKIECEKLVVSASNFTLDENGNMTATNAKLKGTIYLRTTDEMVNSYFDEFGLSLNAYSTTVARVSENSEHSGTYVRWGELSLWGRDGISLQTNNGESIKCSSPLRLDSSLKVGSNYYGQSGYYYVKNSNDDTASFHFENGILVEVSGF